MGRVMVQAPVVKRVEPVHNGWTEEEIQDIIVGEWKDRQKTYKVYMGSYDPDKYRNGHSNLSFDVDYYSEDDPDVQSRPKLITVIASRMGCQIHWGRGPNPSYVVQMENLTAHSLTWIKPNGTRGCFAWTKMMEGPPSRGPLFRPPGQNGLRAPNMKALPPVKAIPPQRPSRIVMDAAMSGPPPKAPPPQLAVAEKQRQRLVHMAPAPEQPPPPPPEEEDTRFHMTLPPVPLPHLSPAEAEDHPLSEQPERLEYEEMEEDFPEEMDLGMEAGEFCPPPSYAPPAPPGYSLQPPGDTEAEACDEEPDRCPPPFMAPPPAPPSSYGHSTQMPAGAVQASQLEHDMMLQASQLEHDLTLLRVEDPGGPPGLDLPEEEDELPLDSLDMQFLEDEDDFLHEAMSYGNYGIDNPNGGVGMDGMQGSAASESDGPGDDAWGAGALLWGKAAPEEDVSFPPHAASSSASSKDTWSGTLPSHHGGEVAPDALPAPGLAAPGLPAPGLAAPGLPAPGLAAPGLAAPIQNPQCEDPWVEEQWGGPSQWTPNPSEEAMLADVNGSLESEAAVEGPGASDSLDGYQDDLLDETCAPAKDPFREQPQAGLEPAPTREEKMKLDELSADLRAALNLGFGGFGFDAGEEKEEASAAPAATGPRFQAPANGQYFRKQPDHSDMQSFSQPDHQSAGVSHMGQPVQDGQGHWYMMVPPGNSSQLPFPDMPWMPREAQNSMQMGMMLSVQYDGSYMQSAMQGGPYPNMYGHYGMMQGPGQMQSSRGNMMGSENGKKRSQRSELQMQASSAEVSNHRAGKPDPSFNNAALPKALRLARERGTDDTASSTQEVYDSSSYDYRSSGHHQYWNERPTKQDYPFRRGPQRWVDRDYDRSHVPREITIGDAENDWR